MLLLTAEKGYTNRATVGTDRYGDLTKLGLNDFNNRTPRAKSFVSDCCKLGTKESSAGRFVFGGYMSEGFKSFSEIARQYAEETRDGKRCPCWMEFRGYRGDSELESMFWHMLLKTDQVWHGAADQLQIGRYRVDAIVDCDGKSVVIELDGAAFHNEVADRVRDAELLKSVDAIIRVPYAPLGYYRFAVLYVLGQWFPRLSLPYIGFTLTEADFMEELNNIKANGEIITDDWIEEVEPIYDIVSMYKDRAYIRSPKGFLWMWNVKPITIQYGTGDPKLIDRIYEKSGCKKINA